MVRELTTLLLRWVMTHEFFKKMKKKKKGSRGMVMKKKTIKKNQINTF